MDCSNNHQMLQNQSFNRLQEQFIQHKKLLRVVAVAVVIVKGNPVLVVIVEVAVVEDPRSI